MDLDGMSEEDMFLMAIAASLADEHQNNGANMSRSEAVPENDSDNPQRSVNATAEIIESIQSSALVSENAALSQNRRSFGIGKLLGTGFHDCDNDEDAITGVLLKDIAPNRVVRFDVSHSRSTSNLSRQNSGDSLKSYDSLSEDAIGALVIEDCTRKTGTPASPGFLQRLFGETRHHLNPQLCRWEIHQECCRA
jgi:hypothetical protein